MSAILKPFITSASNPTLPPINIDHIVSYQKIDVDASNIGTHTPKSVIQIAFTKLDGTRVTWDYKTTAARNAEFTALNTAFATSIA